jgi:hypothetical protein
MLLKQQWKKMKFRKKKEAVFALKNSKHIELRVLIILTVMFLISLPSPSQASFLLPGRHSPVDMHSEVWPAAPA